jgi:hypothetical protein
VITGFNTDIEHDGVVYHVQTEDKGLDTPLILSLVYAGGAILASKRSRYEDLIESGFTDEALSERLSRQHRLICAAVHAGRIEDLKRMSAATAAELKQPATTEIQPNAEVQSDAEIQSDPEILRGDEEREMLEAERIAQAEQYRLEREAEAARAALEPEEGIDVTQEVARPTRPTPPTRPTRPTRVEILIPDSPFPVIEEIPGPDQRRTVMGALPGRDDGLRITILGRQEFRSGDTPTLKVMVGIRVGSHEEPVAKAAVSVKVLGTTFRPQIYSAKTQHDGVAVVTAQIPTFTSGRAAILIKAVASGKETELRRVILPG